MVFPLFDSPFLSIYEEPMVVLIDDLPHKRRCQPSRISPMPKRETAKREVNEPLKITLHIGNFKQDELKVSLTGRILTVEGSHSSSTDSSSFSSSFKRSIPLSDHIDPSTIYSKITHEGMLEIGANPRSIDRQIEITVEKTTDLPNENDDSVPSVNEPILEAVGPDMECDQ